MNTLIFTLFFLFPLSSQASPLFVRTQILMGNVPVSIQIKSVPQKKEAAFQAMEAAFFEAKRIENLVSEFKPQSDISRLNRLGPRQWAKVSDETLLLLMIAQEIAKFSQGAFDVTFASKNKSASYKDIVINEKEKKVFLRKPKMKLGLSGIAKGFIVDRMSALLKQHRFKKFLVNAGGDLYACGKWKIDLRAPIQENEKISFFSFWLKNQAASTSGTYERGPHLIDPHLKKPAKGPQSLTVTHPKAMVSDALATAAFIATPKIHSQLLYHYPKMKMIVVE